MSVPQQITSSDLTAFLQSAQNADGGWPYVRGSSWTEPTVFALLALRASGAGPRPALERGARWLECLQRPDGGLPAQRGVPFASWVTALAALAFSAENRLAARDRALRWLLASMGEETTLSQKMRTLLSGHKPTDQAAGWPWLAGNAAWVTPTVFSILALEHAQSIEASARVAEGRKFLLQRACSDGGWNHGAAEALGYAAHSYPETTGQGLLALRGVSAPQAAKALQKAEEYLPHSRAAQSWAWLKLGLLAHGALSEPRPSRNGLFRARGVMDAALLLLADNAERGQNVL